MGFGNVQFELFIAKADGSDVIFDTHHMLKSWLYELLENIESISLTELVSHAEMSPLNE